MSASPNEKMTVDEVARAAGTTTRNVRAYQTRGLLPPPVMDGRVGRYGREHLARLELIANLQRRGYSLAAIGDLLAAWRQQRTVEELLGLEDELSFSYRDETEQVFTRDELMKQFPMVDADLEVMARIVELELVVPIPPDSPGAKERYRVASPRLLAVGRALLDAGVPLTAALDELDRVRNDARRIASRMVALFTAHVWDPWVAAGQPIESLPDLVDKLRRLKPMPTIAVSSVLAQALDHEVARVAAAKLREIEDLRNS